jgi:polyhydroxybutyrate depolymerase
VMRGIAIALVCACSGSHEAPMQDGANDATDGATPDVPPTSCVGKMTQPADSTWTLMVGSLSRTANVHVPAGYDPQTPTPVVIDMHGRLGNATDEPPLSLSTPKADAEGFIVVYPQAWGSPTSWNAGGCCDPANTNNIDDVGFIHALIDELDAKLCVDDRRVYAMGMSNGGYLSQRLACELADRVAAIGPVAGTLAVQTCNPARPVPVFEVHGDQDPLVPYMYAQQSVTYWAAKYHCGSMMTTYQNGAATCVSHSGCDAGADVVLCTLTGGGHQWPGGGVTLPLLGNKIDDLHATDAIWDFFAAHPRPM